MASGRLYDSPETVSGVQEPDERPRICPATPSSTCPDGDQKDIARMRSEIDRLYREISDSRNSLLTANEHNDLLQEHLYRLNANLAAEIRERQAAEEKLKRILQTISREKGDLEVLIQILIEQGDIFAEEGEKARVDALTLIPNRRRLDEHLTREWARHLRLRQPLSVLLCDIDHFKGFNDCYGHPAGDECLKKVAQSIIQRLRTDDLAARYGGEEFAIVLPHTPRQRALEFAERVRVEVANLAIPHAGSTPLGRVTLSIGVACQIPRSRGNPDASSLLEEADRGLYLAKHAGRNRVGEQERKTSRL
jgi:diguanylate cyclase (GGDEF)-like protein